jgi:hypothetical protein
MTNSSDPTIHQAREREIIAHVEQLLSDDRFVVDTTAGRRAVPVLNPKITKTDHGADVKRTMSEMNLPDRDLQNRMPIGESLEIVLQMTRFWLFTKVVGRVRIVCVSPTRQLLAGESPKPLDLSETRKILSQIPPPLGVPTTIVLVSTSGFDLSAREAAIRTADRTVILIEPNNAGGWNSFGPVETKALADLLDPEAEDEKRNRVYKTIESNQIDLLQGGVAADKLAAKTHLPLGLVEAAVKSYAKQNPGLAAKRLDGRVVLYRDGTVPRATAGGIDMPMIDRIKSLFSRKGETQKKIAFLSERKTALSQQRDRSYEEIASLEQQDEHLKTQFKESSSGLTRRRVTSQLVQLRKDIERRQQMLSVLNQQINIVGTHLHNLELSQQGEVAKLPDSEELAADAAKAEEVLAQLQADSELAESVGGVAMSGMSAEEQTLYEQLEREAGGPATTKIELNPIRDEEKPTPQREHPKRAEPEAG